MKRSESDEERRAKYAERDALHAAARVSECNQCGRQMVVRTSAGEAVLGCPADPTHQGYRRWRSLSALAKEGNYIPYVSEYVERRRQKDKW